MKRFSLLFLNFLLLLSPLKADEGMWLLPLLKQLNINTMREKGCKLTAEEIYAINHSSLKDAIVHFGGGCTAEIVSSEGLLFTNHHCGYDAIQSHSTVDHDYLKDGFWAKTKADELPNKGLTATFLVRIEDISDTINAALVKATTETERTALLDSISPKIAERATKGTHYSAEIHSFFGGNDFYLLVYETYKDVRFVGAPPSSIGKFGADTDNWMWPRHTADFSVFRVYMSPDSMPAEYSEKNIPLKPRQYLSVSTKGVKEGDFTMVIGYPGTTNRYMSSYRTASELAITHPNRVLIRGTRQDIWMKDMQADPAVRIKYASKYARSSNYWKFSQGQIKGLNRLHVVERKKQVEETFSKWVSADAARTAKYGNALTLIKDADAKLTPLQHTLQFYSEGLYRSIDAFNLSRKGIELMKLMSSFDAFPEKITKLVGELKAKTREEFANYNVATDQRVAEAMFQLLDKNLKEEDKATFFKEIKDDFKGDYAKYTQKLYSKSLFVDSVKLMAFLNNPKLSKLEKDPMIKLNLSINEVYTRIFAQADEYYDAIDKGNRLFIAGLREMDKNLVQYPDANSTMRLTYGTVGGYSPADAINYNYYTTLKGVMEKEDPNNWEFVVPQKLKELYQTKDYGAYGSNGELHTCFISNNDITGGNSGSPVLNDKGQLIGLAFDGNWEAMSGDKVFENELQKCICVDIRYVLFIIDKFAGATHLVNELKLEN